jgi:hypothetical protein
MSRHPSGTEQIFDAHECGDEQAANYVNLTHRFLHSFMSRLGVSLACGSLRESCNGHLPAFGRTQFQLSQGMGERLSMGIQAPSSLTGQFALHALMACAPP